MNNQRLNETVTLRQAKDFIKAMAHEQSLLLLSPPGVGKSDTVAQAAREAGLPCRSLLGTQIAPEDVSGIPRIERERSVFCPPRVLLPEEPEPFCLFLDELPACSPEVQKSFYSLLLERRLGEHSLPGGTWVVAAGNRQEDRALVRALSTALVNRVFILHIRADHTEWLQWARANRVRSDVLSFIAFMPPALLRSAPKDSEPFSTPRAWASLARALDLADAAKITDPRARRALVFGRVSAEDAAIFCAISDHAITDLRPVEHYLDHPEDLPASHAARWFVLTRIRELVQRGELPERTPEVLGAFLMALPREHRFALLINAVEDWGRLGVQEALLSSLREALGPA